VCSCGQHLIRAASKSEAAPIPPSAASRLPKSNTWPTEALAGAWNFTVIFGWRASVARVLAGRFRATEAQYPFVDADALCYRYKQNPQYSLLRKLGVRLNQPSRTASQTPFPFKGAAIRILLLRALWHAAISGLPHPPFSGTRVTRS
jgi:hypothetical protein